MEFLFENIPIVILIAGICALMRYPYIGAGLLLAALCFEVGHYWLMAGCFVICVLLHSIMGKHIKPRKGMVRPSPVSRKQRRKKSGNAGGEDAKETQTR